MPVNNQPPQPPPNGAPLKFPRLMAGGVPLLMTPQERAAALKKAGLSRGWSLMSHGELAIIDRNMRQMVESYNKMGDVAHELKACLELACKVPEGETEPAGLDDERLEAAMALELPQRVEIKAPKPPPVEGGN